MRLLEPLPCPDGAGAQGGRRTRRLPTSAWLTVLALLAAAGSARGADQEYRCPPRAGLLLVCLYSGSRAYDATTLREGTAVCRARKHRAGSVPAALVCRSGI
jgi:hypothetical protein